MGATAAAAAVIFTKEKELVAHFRAAGALSARSAKSAAELAVHTGGTWHRLERRGIIRDAGQGLYYLDEHAWGVSRKWRRRAAVAILVIVCGVLVISLFAVSRAAGSQH